MQNQSSPVEVVAATGKKETINVPVRCCEHRVVDHQEAAATRRYRLCTIPDCRCTGWIRQSHPNATNNLPKQLPKQARRTAMLEDGRT